MGAVVDDCTWRERWDSAAYEVRVKDLHEAIGEARRLSFKV